ncbi:MAG: sodium:proton exchanger [Candidatus Omnitrophica bacterium]|nr:sodium:proton exchanger [Candidatus Omnitrophota bacterium]
MIQELSTHFNAILTFGIILLAGYVAGRVANFLKLPKVTGYIIAGVLLEPSVTGLLPQKFMAHSSVVNNFALCIITYAIGGSLSFRKIRSLGNTIWVMTIFESVMTFLMISVGLFFLLPLLTRYAGLSVEPVLFLPLAILAGSLGAPTDPTPTLAVKEEYRASGPVTTTILGIGAFDDAMGIMIFSLATAAGAAMVSGSAGGLASAIIKPLGTIFFSILTGGLFALFLLASSRKVQDKGVMVALILGSLFACFGIAQAIGLDELLSTMTFGCVVVNLAKDEDKYFLSVRDYFEEMVFTVFFVIAGANLQLGILKSALAVVIIFVALRVAGKVAGSYTGAVISGAKENVKKYTALGLVPQGGIIVGLALLLKEQPAFSGMATILLNVILGTTVLFEFIGPLLTEIAIKRSEEAGKGE